MIKSSYLEELREEVRTLGRADELRRAVLRLGRQRFRKPASGKQKAQLEGVTDVSRLRRIQDHLLTAGSWDDLLATL